MQGSACSSRQAVQGCKLGLLAHEPKEDPQPLAPLGFAACRVLTTWHALRLPTLLLLLLLSAQAAGYGKVVSHVIIGLKTVKGTKQLKLDPTIYDSLQKERVQVRAAAALTHCCSYACIRSSALLFLCLLVRLRLHMHIVLHRQHNSTPEQTAHRLIDHSHSHNTLKTLALSQPTPNPGTLTTHSKFWRPAVGLLVAGGRRHIHRGQLWCSQARGALRRLCHRV